MSEIVFWERVARRKVNWIEEKDNNGADARTLQVPPARLGLFALDKKKKKATTERLQLEQIDRKKLDFAKSSLHIHMEETRHGTSPSQHRMVSLSSPFWTALPLGSLSWEIALPAGTTL